MPELRHSPAFNPAADDADAKNRVKIDEMEDRIARLSLTNRKLRDRIKNLVDLLADFGCYVDP